jgi:hypothetical protein
MYFVRHVLWTIQGLSSNSTNSQVMDRPTMIGGPSTRIKVKWAELAVLKFLGRGLTSRGRRTIHTLLFLIALTCFKWKVAIIGGMDHLVLGHGPFASA